MLNNESDFFCMLSRNVSVKLSVIVIRMDLLTLATPFWNNELIFPLKWLV